MRVLIVGQLPKEIGGNYTTGAANVVYELGRKREEGVLKHTFGTNISKRKARQNSSYTNQYLGYSKILFFRILSDVLFHPIRTANQWRHYRLIDHENPLRYAFYKVCIEEAINKVKPDIIHVNSIGNISPTRFALGARKIPVVLTCHGIFYRGDKDDIIGRDRYLGNIVLADAYSGLTNEALEEFHNYLGIPKERVTIIPNGADCDKFYFSPGKRDEIRIKLGLTDKVKVLLTVASVQERKGQFAFCKLLSHLEDTDFQYWIIGQGPDVDIIQEYIIQNHLDNKVKLLGFHAAEELYAYYSAADIYAHVSTKEGQALCEIEASATGLRTIINKNILGTIPEVENKDCYILDMDDVDYSGLAQWINRTIGVRKSSRSLDWQNIANMYANLYRKVLQEYKGKIQ